MAEPKTNPHPLIRIGTDIGPLAIFFLVNAYTPGMELERALRATLAFMVAAAIAIAVSWWKTGRISPMLWVTSVLVLVFGGLTLYFHDVTFIKMKPTLVYLTFSAVLAFGLITGRPLLQMALDAAYPGLSPRGWRLLTINWTLFFIGMAIANEAVWRNVNWDTWVSYKVWGATAATVIFALANIPMLMKHGLKLGDDAATQFPPEG